jgi:transposase InsO family protein
VLLATGLKRSSYYYTRSTKDKRAERAHKDDQVIQAIDEIRQEFGSFTEKYGYRRISAKLKEMGFVVNKKRVLRIMKEHNWLSTYNNRGKRKYNSYRGTIGTIAPNRIHRRFITDRPYQKLVADVSEFRFGGMSQSERVYLEPIMDMFSGEILAYAISDHPTVEFALKPLEEALSKLPKLNYRTTVHTDQGFQYQNHRWVKSLKEHHVFQSMSRKATCLDNAAMESFFSVMKAEMLDKHYETRAELIAGMTEWLKFYNNKRIKNRLKGKSPVEYRKLALQQAA